jgi:hypothetical protein
MISSFTTRFRSLIWFVIFTFTLYCLPHLELLLPNKIHFSLAEAGAADLPETETVNDQTEALEEQDGKEPPPEDKSLLLTMADISGGGALGSRIVLVENSNFTGNAVSKIPIIVPPGRGGMAPQIALTYNSHQGNGWIGVGWSLDMGAIQRSTKWGLNYNPTDLNKAYVTAVGGSSSELITRADWGTGYFGSKIEETNTKYYKNPATGGWEVTTKDGTLYKYGSTSASRQDNTKGIFKWCLDKVQDTKGNYMTISYYKEQGEIYLDRIDYAGNGGLGPTNYVSFLRLSRDDVPEKYNTHSSVKTASRLKEIKVYGNNQLVRKYVLNYAPGTSSNRSLLTTITEYGNDEVTALPLTTLIYQDKSAGFDSDSQKGMRKSAYHANSPGFRMADVNGDAIPDLIYDDSSRNIHVLLGTRPGAFADDEVWGVRAQGYSSGSLGFRMADVNGDGCADFIYDSGTEYGIRVLTSNACNQSNSFSQDSSWGTRAEAYSADAGSFKMADVNGDGLADFVYDSGTTNGVRVLLSTGTGFPVDNQWGMRAKGYSAESGGFKMTDVNGDGLADFVYDSGTTNGVRVLLSDGVDSFSADTAPWGTRTNAYASNSGGFRMADVNGDGLPDFVYDSGTDFGIRVLEGKAPFPHLLSRVTNSIGGITNITYEPS